MAQHEEIQPGPDDFRTTSDVRKPDALVTRRTFIKRSVQLAVAGALIPATLAQVLPAIAPDALAGGGAGPIIKRDKTTNTKSSITLADLAGNPPVVVTAEWNYLPAVVYKVRRAILESATKERGYNTGMFAVTHPEEPDNVILVYEGKCKHLGCTVGWNAGLGGSKDVPDYDGDGVNDGRILCPCHQGQYDIYDLAKNVPGTPPPKPLNVIEFDVANYTDPDNSDLNASNAILGVVKHVQEKYRDAEKGDKVLDLSGTSFTVRDPGWSA